MKQSIVVTRQFYKALRLEEPGLQNPMTDVSVPVPDNAPEWNVLHEGQTKELLAEVSCLNERACVLALVLQGWRVSELCAMTRRNVREQKGHQVVEWRAKRKKLRTQRLQPAVLEAIQKRDAAGRHSGLPSEPLFPDPDGRPYSRHDVYNFLRRACKKAGLKVTPHGLRATYISSVIDRKGIEAARQLAGQDSIATTQKYSRWRVDADDDLTPEDL